jgi:acyl carrier protein
LRASDTADVSLQALAEFPRILQQTVGGAACEVVLDLLCGVELRGLGRELFHMQPGISLAHRINRSAIVNGATVPEQHDRSPQMSQERPQEVSHVHGLEVTPLPAEVQPQVLPLRGHGERGHSGEPLVSIVVGDDRCLALGCPGTSARGPEQKAALIDVLPLTPNGEVDRHALPVPNPLAPLVERTFVPPRTPVEKVLAEIWSEVLGLEYVGAYDKFFELGGHSLKATQIMSRVRHALDIELPLRGLFATPTVADLALTIDHSQMLKESHENLISILEDLEQLSAMKLRNN